mmetsp:Transcript_14420/g.26975  ORF Transcript_14420/g.26975 Transcript_14420/m.26975 type:complete len:210 (-) Transcript_14420:129-758(-)
MMESDGPPLRMLFWKISLEPPPVLTTASISSGVASGFTIFSCRFIFFLMSVLNFCWLFWYAFITSTNLRVRVFTRFSRMRISFFSPLAVEVFWRSVSSRRDCSSCFATEAFLLVAWITGDRPADSSCSFSGVVASTTSWLIWQICLVAVDTARMFCFTSSTSAKNCFMKVLCPSPAARGLVVLPLTSRATDCGGAAPLRRSRSLSFIAR